MSPEAPVAPQPPQEFLAGVNLEDIPLGGSGTGQLISEKYYEFELELEGKGTRFHARMKMPHHLAQPLQRRQGRSLGSFVVTAYNIASEADHPEAPNIAAIGLNRQYSRTFLSDIIMQGSGVDNGGRLIQIDWSRGAPSTPERTHFRYVAAIITGGGRRLENGVSIAVDPTEIPLGSWVWIDTVGWRRADDTGGRISGRHIDLFILAPRREVLHWGTQSLRVCAEATPATQ